MAKRRYNFIISAVLGLAASTLAIGVSFGWFLNGWIGQGSVVKFTSSKTLPPDFIMWTYTTSEEGTPGWKQGTTVENGTTIESDINIGQITTTSSTTTRDGISVDTTTFAIESLQIGSVDNLVSIKDDNILYMRFKIDPTKQGHEIHLHVGYADSSYLGIYDNEGVDIYNTAYASSTIGESLTGLCDETSFLLFDYAIDTNAYSPSDTNFSNLEFLSVTYTDSESVEHPGDFIKESDAAYYLYLKIYPDLMPFREVAGMINKYMPCTILYDLEISLDSFMEIEDTTSS